MIPSKNLGVTFEDGKLHLCFVSYSERGSYVAFKLSDYTPVDISQIDLINDLFYEQKQPDGGPFSEKLAHVANNKNCKTFSKLSADKSIVILRDLSIFEPDMFWYSEDHGVSTVNINENKEFKLKDLLKAESKINKIEQKSREKEQVESKNLGVTFEDGKLHMCYVSKSDNAYVAFRLDNYSAVDISNIELINDMFYEKKSPDGGPFSEKMAHIAHNTNCKIFKVLSPKSIELLKDLSILKSDIYWYSEDHGVGTVITEDDKTFALKDVFKIEDKINKIEKKLEKSNQTSESEMQ